MAESEGSPRQVDVSAAQRGRSAEPGLLPLLPDGLQLGDSFEILPPARGALQTDERVEGHAQAVGAENVDGLGFLLEILVAPAAGDFAQKVERAERGRASVEPNREPSRRHHQ